MSRIRILVPGKAYTQGFLRGITSLAGALHKSDISHTITNYYGPYLPEVRNRLLLDGQKPTLNVTPFGGDYEYIMWIETDIVFTPEDFFNLYKSMINNNLDFLTGLFPMGPNYPPNAVAGTWKNGRIPMNAAGLQEIDYCGVGFLLVKKGVYESLGYPWYGAGNIYTYHLTEDQWIYNGDDFSTAMRLKEKGWKLYANCNIKLGHEKTTIAKGWEE